MSRVGKQPITIPASVSVQVNGPSVTVKGPKGTSTWSAPQGTTVAYEDKMRRVIVGRTEETKQARAFHGLSRALIANMVKGVSEGFEKRIEIYGTGYNCKVEGRKLHLNIGFSGRRRGIGSQFELAIPEGVEVAVEVPAARGENEPAKLVVRSADRQKVGQFSAEIRSLRKTEPYRGKGIRYAGEVVRRKQGKALTSGG